MPEMRWVVVWPDGDREECYSPSLVITDYFHEGQTYPIEDFMERGRTALTIASERVRAKYGFPCSRALNQLARLEAVVERFSADPDASVTCNTFIFDDQEPSRSR